MAFKKLLPALKDSLVINGIETPTPFQRQILSKIKSGANIFGIAPKGAGKTTSIIISTIQKLNGIALEEAPRALIFVKDKEAALELEQKFNSFIESRTLRVFSVFDQHLIMNQKDLIYDGVDIVIATPKRLSKLYFQCGINLNQIQTVIIEDADFIMKNNLYTEVNRISNSIHKCQYLVFAERFDSSLERLTDSFMEISEVVEVTE